MQAAIAIFAYNRPASLERLLVSLVACPEFPSSSVTVFIDGPRSAEDEPGVAATIEVAQRFSSNDWTVRVRKENLGLRQSILDGVTEVCEKFGHVIVLEGDLELSSIALTYFMSALEKYEHHRRVWCICGYGMHGSGLDTESRAFFLPYAHPWGWATWQRAWSQFDPSSELISASAMRSKSFRRSFNLSGLIDATELMYLAKRNLVSSWYIYWYATIFKAGGVSLFPSVNVARNLGLARGTHGSSLNPYALLHGKLPRLANEVPLLPDTITVDYRALDQMAKGKDAFTQRLIAKIGSMKRRIVSKFRPSRHPSPRRW